MVGLVLDTSRQELRTLDGHRLPVHVHAPGHDPQCPLGVIGEPGQGQAPLLAVLLLVGQVEYVKTRRDTPICGAANPTPGASIMVSVRSATSVRNSLSKVSTGAAGVRSTGSPNSRIGCSGMPPF